MNKKSYNKIYFLCSPSLGILDSWISVLDKIKNNNKDIEIDCILMKAGNVKHINPDNVLVKYSEKIFDNVYYQTYCSKWKRSDSLITCKKESSNNWIENKIESFRVKIAARKYLFLFSNLIVFIQRLIEFLIHGQDDLCLQKNNFEKSVLMFDIYEESKVYNKEILKIFKDQPKFSICHGIDINQDDIIPLKTNRSDHDKHTVFLYSKAEENYYLKTYDLRADNLVVTGVPRHNKAWLDTLKKNSKLDTKFNKYVFIISRSLCKYFTNERKREAIENIKKILIEKFNYKLVIKFHPKEMDDGLFEDILGRENFGSTWITSDDHPMVIGEKADFAVTFYSGVCVDMLYLNVPVIEYLSLIGLDGYDNEKSLRDVNGHPVLSYRYLGLVEGVSNENELTTKVSSLIENRDLFLTPLKANYTKFFSSVNEPLEKVVKTINEKMNGRLNE